MNAGLLDILTSEIREREVSSRRKRRTSKSLKTNSLRIDHFIVTFKVQKGIAKKGENMY